LLTFSLIPSFFGYCWCGEKEQEFVSFLEAVLGIDEEAGMVFGRVIFGLPEFRMFWKRVLESVASELTNLDDVEPGFQRGILEKLVDSWHEYRDCAPSLICSVLRVASDPGRFLTVAFLEPAFRNPHAFELIRIVDDWPASVGESLLDICVKCNFGADMAASLLDDERSASSQPLDDAVFLLPRLRDAFVFGERDLPVFRELAVLLESYPAELRPIFATAEPDANDPCGFYVIILPDDTEGTLTSEAEIELKLRSMLLDLDVTPERGNSRRDLDIIGMLKPQLGCCDGFGRRDLVSKIDGFKRQLDESGSGEWTFEMLIELLRSSFNNPAGQRMDDTCQIPLWRKCAATFREILGGELVPLLWSATFPIQRRILQQFLQVKDLRSMLAGQTFEDGSRTFLSGWMAWQEAYEYHFPLEFRIFHEFLMRHFTYAGFIEGHPELARYDKNAKTLMEQQVARDLPDWQVPPPGESWRKVFLDNPEFIDSVVEGISAFCTPSTPMRMLTELHHFNDRLHDVMTLLYEGRDCGQDQLVPAQLFALEVSSAVNLISALDYVMFHMKSLFEENDKIGALYVDFRGHDAQMQVAPSLLYYVHEYAAAFDEQLNVVSLDLM
jgi:hypothetical protein